MKQIPIQVNNAAQNTIDRHKRMSSGRIFNSGDTSLVGTRSPEKLVGAVCINQGCKAVFTAAIGETQCQFHPGTIGFNQGAKAWTCCGRKIQNLLGCVQGAHNWFKRELVDVRDDWFQQAGFVHISVYCKGAIPEGTKVESDGLRLTVAVVHAFGAKETKKHFDLFAEIIPHESVMIVSEKKVELVLKQRKRENWIKLRYDGALDGATFDEEGAYLEPDDE